MRQVYVNDGRNPFEMLFFIICIVSGLSALLDPSQASELVRHAFGPYLQLFQAGIILGGGVSLSGVLQRRLNAGALMVERVGLILLGGLMLAYGGAIVWNAVSVAGLLITGVFGAGCFVRVWQITRDLSRIKDAQDKADRELIHSKNEPLGGGS